MTATFIRSGRSQATRRLLFKGALATTLLLLVFRAPIQRSVTGFLILRSPAPLEKSFFDWVDSEPDKVKALERAWSRGGIPHRVEALQYLQARHREIPSLTQDAESLLVQAAFDADLSVRETAVPILAEHKNPWLPIILERLLGDADDASRLLALKQLSRLPTGTAVPLAGPLLDDPVREVAATAAAVLRNASGLDFGVRLALPKGTDPAKERAAREAFASGMAQWKGWWKEHQADYPPQPGHRTLPPSGAAHSAADFSLPDLEGKTIQLSNFRGRVVLLNFWATWCETCSEELPELQRLRHLYGDSLVILSISLDGVPDEEGEHDSSVEGSHKEGAVETGASKDETFRTIQKFVKKFRIANTVLWDSTARAGRCYDGGELPTNVLIGPGGEILRRFLGTRSDVTWQRLLGEAGLKPSHTPP